MYQFVLAYAYTYLYLYAYIKEHYLERPFMFFLHLRNQAPRPTQPEPAQAE